MTDILTTAKECGARDYRQFGAPDRSVEFYESQLAAFVERIRAERWIPVSERLPEDHRSVVVWVPFTHGSGCFNIANYHCTEDDDKRIWQDDEGNPLAPYEPSYWMALQPPFAAIRSAPPVAPAPIKEQL